MEASIKCSRDGVEDPFEFGRDEVVAVAEHRSLAVVAGMGELKAFAFGKHAVGLPRMTLQERSGLHPKAWVIPDELFQRPASVAADLGEVLFRDREDAAGRLVGHAVVEDACLERSGVVDLHDERLGVAREVGGDVVSRPGHLHSHAALADVGLEDQREAPAVRSDNPIELLESPFRGLDIQQRRWGDVERPQAREDLILRLPDEPAVRNTGVGGGDRAEPAKAAAADRQESDPDHRRGIEQP
jgi:hypothetical protein